MVVCFGAIAATALLLAGSAETLAQSSHHKKKSRKVVTTACKTGCTSGLHAQEAANASADGQAQPGAAASDDAAAQRELTRLAHDLRDATPGSYEKLSAFAARNAGNAWGARAALALGYDDYQKNHARQAVNWLEKAKGDLLLREYAVYWISQAQIALNNKPAALAELTAMQTLYPNTAMKEQLVDSLATTATDLSKPQAAIDALNAYPSTDAKPSLLLDRARAYLGAHQPVKSAKDYQTIYYKYPLSDEAKAAGTALKQINHQLGKEYSYPGVEMQVQRAEAFYAAHQWRDARNEYEKVLGMLHDHANPVRQKAELRVAQCRVEMHGSLRHLTSLKTPDPEVEAERLYSISQEYRSDKKESKMLEAIEEIATKYPQSQWNEEGLMAAGNYYWVLLDRTNAAKYYQRLLDAFPGGKNAYNCEWRVAWVDYMNRKPEAEDKLRAFLVKYPVSGYAPDALYWLGRIAERKGNAAEAKALYEKDQERFPQTYFGRSAGGRIAKVASAEDDPIAYLDKIPPPPALRSVEDAIPAAGQLRWERAMALRSIGFDASAEQEFKAAFFATSSPRFLFEAAHSAFDQGHYGAGMAYGRILVPSFDARKFDDLPISLWKTLYPLPYEDALRREAAKNDFDPMLAAGLIRQESTFQADAVSRAHAVGLMQVLPKTGRKLARQLRVRYSHRKLFDPDYNIELGMRYIADLLQDTGAPEYALAAFNAGEDRIALWRGERNFEEIPELVESIPFTETREYVQIVLRNAEVYRMIYGPGGTAADTTASSRSR